MSNAFGSQKPETFQVAVSSLTLGTLYEAVLAFSSQDRFETFWPSVCQNARWLIPSRRMGIVLSHEEGGFEVVGLFEQGKYHLPEESHYAPGRSGMDEALEASSAQWLDKPADRFKVETDSLSEWLFRDRPHSLFVLPIRAKGKPIGVLLFATAALEESDRAMLNTLGTIYGLHVGMTYTLIRITDERRQMQERLAVQEKMASLGSLVAGVAHEVNTPIGSILSAADVSIRCIRKLNELIQEIDGHEDIKQDPRLEKASTLLNENYRVITDAGNRIAMMVQSLKNFAKLDEAEYQKVDVHDGIENTLRFLHHDFEGKVTVVSEYGSIPEIHCFPSQLNQVFMHLLVNAAQSIDDQGVVTIKTSVDDESVYVKISDTGRGIPAKNIGKIFDPGFTTKGGLGVGTGLGLSICYNIMQKHRGSISVESEVGRGTEFTLTLPRKLP
ncbi:MAG: ATP-binding protein [Vicinamibacteria bacterium]